MTWKEAGSRRSDHHETAPGGVSPDFDSILTTSVHQICWFRVRVLIPQQCLKPVLGKSREPEEHTWSICRFGFVKPSIIFTSPLWTEQHLEVPSVFVASSVLCLEEFARAPWRPHYHACTDLSSCNIVFRLRLCRIRNWESITALMTCLLLTEKVGRNFTRITQFDFAQGNCLKKHLPAGPAKEDVTLERFWLNFSGFLW